MFLWRLHFWSIVPGSGREPCVTRGSKAFLFLNGPCSQLDPFTTEHLVPTLVSFGRCHYASNGRKNLKILFRGCTRSTSQFFFVSWQWKCIVSPDKRMLPPCKPCREGGLCLGRHIDRVFSTLVGKRPHQCVRLLFLLLS